MSSQLDDLPDRPFVMLGGEAASRYDLDMISLVVSLRPSTGDMQPELAEILHRCLHPTSVVELTTYLGLPITWVKILVGQLLEAHAVEVRQPQQSDVGAPGPDIDLLERVIKGLKELELNAR